MNPQKSPDPNVNKKVTKSAAIVSIAVMGSRVMGLVREQVFAASFGAGAVADAYQVAFRIPNLLRDLFAEGALSAAFTKTFAQYRAEHGEAASWRLAALVWNALAVIMSVICLAGILFAPQLVAAIAGGFSPEKIKLATTLTQILFPFILLVSLAAVAMGALNTHNVFGLPASSSTVFNITSVIFGLGLAYGLSGGNWIPELKTMSDKVQWAIIGMAIGTLIGGAAQLLIQMPTLWKLGFRPIWQVSFRDSGVQQVMKLMGPAILGASTVQINVLVNTYLVSHINGGQAWLGYAFRLMQFPIGVFGVAIAMASLAMLARQAAEKKMDDFKQTLRTGLNLVFILTIPSALGLIALGEPIIALIYQHGAFTASDTKMAAYALMAYSVGLAGYATIKVLIPAWYALGDTKTPMYVSIFSVFLNFILANLLLKILMPYGLGHAGVALSTATIALFNCFLLWFLLQRREVAVRNLGLGKNFAKICLAGFAMLLACGSVDWVLETYLIENISQHLLRVLVGLGIGGLVYVILGYLLKIEGLESIVNKFLGKIKRK